MVLQWSFYWLQGALLAKGFGLYDIEVPIIQGSVWSPESVGGREIF